MPHGVITQAMPAGSDEVFALLHDYTIRMNWDTLLCEAYLEEAWPSAQVGAVAVCRSKARVGGIALKIRYITFKPPVVAAVTMINRPWFFDAFSATIRNVDRPDGTSTATYTFQFTARPRWLRPLLHPLMQRMLAWETRRRLRALARYLAGPRCDGRGDACDEKALADRPRGGTLQP